VQVDRVQKWVMSALLLTVATIFATGMSILAGVAEGPGAQPGLLVIAGAVGLLAMGGVRLINQKSLLTPWLLAGLLPAVVGWYFLYIR
jgi:hypothetical protein